MLLPVRIHSWGGLGSQLYALALSIDLETKVLHRKYIFINHTSGTSKRLPEILFYTRNIKLIDDYVINEQHNKAKSQANHNIKKFIKKLITSTGFYAECNSDKDFQLVKPWVTVIRGHYSHRQVSMKSITHIFQEIQNSYSSSHVSNQERKMSFHYRLGDLEVISEKSPIRFDSIQRKISEIISIYDYQILNLYSDTPVLALQRLNNSDLKVSIKYEDKSTLETIYECVMSETFVGTNSKISFWVAIFRSKFKTKGSTYLPLEIKHMMDFQNELVRNHEINYY